MKKITLYIALAILCTTVKAGDFERSIGVRFSGNSGIYFDQLNPDLSSTRIQLGWRQEGTQVTAMKIFRRYNLDQLPENFSFFYGYGAHAGYVHWKHYNSYIEGEGTYWTERYAPVFGLDGICGVSYNMKKMPLAFNLEVKPYFDYWGKEYFKLNVFDFSLSVEYNF